MILKRLMALTVPSDFYRVYLLANVGQLWITGSPLLDMAQKTELITG